MTDITVNIETASGGAAIELRGLTTSDTRFRLYDIAADKYLTKRGWTKTPSSMPAEAVLGDDLIRIPLDAELVRKIASRASLSLEQPSTDFRQVFLWPASETPVVPAAVEVLPQDEPIAVEAALADLAADTTTAPDVSPVDDSVLGEPTIEPPLDDVASTPQSRDIAPEAAAGLFDESEPRQSWLPIAVAAALFLILGFGLAYLLIGSGSDSQVQQISQAAEKQRAADQAEFAKRLAEAQDTSKETAVVIAEAGTKTADLAAKADQLTEARDAALKSAADKDSAVRALQTELEAARTEIESFKASGDKVDARVAELTAENQSLASDRDSAFKTIADKDALVRDLQSRLTTAQAESQNAAATAAALDKARSDLAEREKRLRDVQSKLEVADVQIDALKSMAGKNSEAGLETSALQDKVAQLTADLDVATKTADDDKRRLAALDQKLTETEAKLVTAIAERDRKASTSATASSDPTTTQLQQERDLYAKELKTLTESFAALKAQKEGLEKQVTSLKGDDKGPAVAGTPETAADAFWGATAIDMGGAIYAVNNQATKATAQANALAKCRGQSDFGCQALTSFQNSCISVARFQGEGPATDNYAFSVHPKWRRSAAEALGRCERLGQACTVRFTSCAPDTLSKPISE